jgi:hypothetical protein
LVLRKCERDRERGVLGEKFAEEELSECIFRVFFLARRRGGDGVAACHVGSRQKDPLVPAILMGSVWAVGYCKTIGGISYPKVLRKPKRKRKNYFCSLTLFYFKKISYKQKFISLILIKN